MRPIKFRAWDKRRKQMAIVDELNHISSWSDKGMMGVNGDDNYGTIGIMGGEHNDCELMQFTGLFDKNGKGIYEGDIVLFERNRDGFAELQWRKEIKFETDMYNAKFDFPCFDSCEVIGNIYENPDLLSK